MEAEQGALQSSRSASTLVRGVADSSAESGCQGCRQQQVRLSLHKCNDVYRYIPPTGERIDLLVHVDDWYFTPSYHALKDWFCKEITGKYTMTEPNLFTSLHVGRRVTRTDITILPDFVHY